jgi:hypothetical protein
VAVVARDHEGAQHTDQARRDGARDAPSPAGPGARAWRDEITAGLVQRRRRIAWACVVGSGGGDAAMPCRSSLVRCDVVARHRDRDLAIER